MSRCLILCCSKRVTLEQVLAWVNVNLHGTRQKDVMLANCVGDSRN